jgi:hypothetical protein
MQEMHAYVSLRGQQKAMEMSDVATEQMKLYQQHWWKPVHLDIPRPSDQMGGTALAQPWHGAAGQNEHRSVLHNSTLTCARWIIAEWSGR